MKIVHNRRQEEVLLNTLVRNINNNKKTHIHVNKTLLLNVDPYNSSIAAQRLIHKLGEVGEPLDMLSIEIPEKGQNYLPFELKFEDIFNQYKNDYENFLVFTLNNNDGKDLIWITNVIKKFKIPDDRILTTAMFETMACDFNCDVVSNYYKNIWNIVYYFEKNPNEKDEDSLYRRLL